MSVDFVADYILMKGEKPNGEALTQLSLQKLVYICQGWYLAVADETLFPEELYAYEYGPVVKELRKRFRFIGADPLPMSPITDAARILSPGAKRVIDSVWDRYARMPTSKLVDFTHTPGSPWSLVWNGALPDERENLIIPTSLIRDWFRLRLEEKLQPRRPRPRDLAAVFDNAMAGA